MPQPDGLAPDRAQWRDFIQSLDGRLATAIQTYECQVGTSTGRELADAFNDLFRLRLPPFRGGGDPSYRGRAFPLAYVLHYQAARVASVVSALDAAAERIAIGVQRDVLDIGSGLDAVSLALEACNLLGSEHRVICVDPSDDMRRFATLIDSTARRDHKPATIEGLAQSSLSGPRFDSIFLSYSLQFSLALLPAWPSALGERLARWLRSGGFVLVVEPKSKQPVLARLHLALRARREFDVYYFCRGPGLGLPQLRRDVVMRQVNVHRVRRAEAAREAGLKDYAYKQLYEKPNVLYPASTRIYSQEVILAAIRR